MLPRLRDFFRQYEPSLFRVVTDRPGAHGEPIYDLTSWLEFADAELFAASMMPGMERVDSLFLYRPRTKRQFWDLVRVWQLPNFDAFGPAAIGLAVKLGQAMRPFAVIYEAGAAREVYANSFRDPIVISQRRREVEVQIAFNKILRTDLGAQTPIFVLH